MTSKEQAKRPEDLLNEADKHIQDIIKRTIKLERENRHRTNPRLKDDFVRIVEDVINETD